MTKLIFVLQGYEQENGGALADAMVFELYAKSYKEAVVKAKKIYAKPFYRLSRVIEVENKTK